MSSPRYAPEDAEVAIRALKEMGAEMEKQDNAITSHPIFVVQQRHRIYGLDPDYDHDGSCTVWLHCDGGEADDDERKRLDERWDDEGTSPEEWTRTAYVDEWRFVQPFFTRVAAERYIATNGHNLKEPRIYVESAYRNDEWQAVRTASRALATIRAGAGTAPQITKHGRACPECGGRPPDEDCSTCGANESNMAARPGEAKATHTEQPAVAVYGNSGVCKCPLCYQPAAPDSETCEMCARVCYARACPGTEAGKAAREKDGT